MYQQPPNLLLFVIIKLLTFWLQPFLVYLTIQSVVLVHNDKYIDDSPC